MGRVSKGYICSAVLVVGATFLCMVLFDMFSLPGAVLMTAIVSLPTLLMLSIYLICKRYYPKEVLLSCLSDLYLANLLACLVLLVYHVIITVMFPYAWGDSFTRSWGIFSVCAAGIVSLPGMVLGTLCYFMEDKLLPGREYREDGYS
ncbi:hypothetical protein EDC56_1490 [Sinobacterium caligoides]|uniref:Uncharacterized protein n=1 Tax=Sinobacterium caligoides TaxID=933926 RepID=A0A3N2DMM6_9GAMM|nr:hypothetical protein [Sinobacterium caligoides]ROS01066.1 hypothetical protein EDC56_1490 [Sinobacterium caligoides]